MMLVVSIHLDMREYEKLDMLMKKQHKDLDKFVYDAMIHELDRDEQRSRDHPGHNL